MTTTTVEPMTKNGHDIHVPESKRFDFGLLDDAPEPLAIGSLGGGLHFVNRQTKELSEEFAIEILELKEWKPDRNKDDDWIVHLKTAMERGTFLPELCDIVTCRFKGELYRMNGQHTAWARLALNDKKWRCPVNLLTYRAETEADMRRLYATIDRNKPRTKGQVVIAHLYCTGEWDGFKKNELKLLAEGLGVWKWKTHHERKQHDGDDRAYLMQTEHHAIAKKVGEFIRTCQIKRDGFLYRAPVCGSMFATFSAHQEISLKFWQAVRDGTGFSQTTDPRLHLRNHLVGTSIDIGKGADKDKKRVSGEEMYRWCITAWNYFRDGKQMKNLLRAAGGGTDRPKVK